MPSALNMLSKHERASYCNRYWENHFKKVCFYKLIVICFSYFYMIMNKFEYELVQLMDINPDT